MPQLNRFLCQDMNEAYTREKSMQLLRAIVHGEVH
jgi:hypothetical protein